MPSQTPFCQIGLMHYALLSKEYGHFYLFNQFFLFVLLLISFSHLINQELPPGQGLVNKSFIQFLFIGYLMVSIPIAIHF